MELPRRPSARARRSRALRRLRMWLALRLQARRRRQTGPQVLAVPAAPSNLQAGDLAGGVALTWDNTGVEFEDGFIINGRLDVPEADFEEVGRAGPGENRWEMEIPEAGTWQFKVRAFNASGVSDYSNVVTIELC